MPWRRAKQLKMTHSYLQHLKFIFAVPEHAKPPQTNTGQDNSVNINIKIIMTGQLHKHEATTVMMRWVCLSCALMTLLQTVTFAEPYM